MGAIVMNLKTFKKHKNPNWELVLSCYKKELNIKDPIQQTEILNYIISTGSFAILDYYRSFGSDYQYFSISQFEKYMKDRKSSFNVHDIDSYILKYGEELGIMKFNAFKEKLNKRNVYDLNYQLSKGHTPEAAMQIIEDIKSRTRGSKENYIRKYGEKLGLEKYNIFCKKSANSKEKFIDKYGSEQGSVKWENYLKKKDSMSVSFFQSKYGDDWETKRKDRIRTTTINRDRYIKKFGIELGNIKFDELVHRRINHAKFGAPKASIEFFAPILNFLLNNQLEYRIGFGKNSEFRIYCEKEKRSFYYDLVIPEIQLCIEYRGIHVHPNPYTFTEDLKKSWRCPFRKINYQEAITWDEFKKEKLKNLTNIDMIAVYSDEICNVIDRDNKYSEIYAEILNRKGKKNENI